VEKVALSTLTLLDSGKALKSLSQKEKLAHIRLKQTVVSQHLSQMTLMVLKLKQLTMMTMTLQR